MDLDELLALIAAPLFAQRLGSYLVYRGAIPKTKTTWEDFREPAMRASVREAEQLWGIVLNRAKDAK